MNGHFNKRGRNHQRRRQGVNPNRALDSNGPDVRIRGTAQQIYDKYLALARDASSAGDRVKAENYLQHAEHYFRVLRAIQGPQAMPSGDGAQDGDFDGGDQPMLGDQPREHREHRQPQPSYDSDEASQDAGGGDQPSEPPSSSEANAAPERHANDGQSRNGDGEGRRRRRRPRRNREDAPADEAADEPEPASA